MYPTGYIVAELTVRKRLAIQTSSAKFFWLSEQIFFWREQGSRKFSGGRGQFLTRRTQESYENKKTPKKTLVLFTLKKIR